MHCVFDNASAHVKAVKNRLERNRTTKQWCSTACVRVMPGMLTPVLVRLYIMAVVHAVMHALLL